MCPYRKGWAIVAIVRVVDLTIQDIAFGGKGVGREQGKAVFVPYVIEDELVSAEIIREKKQFAEAELVEVKQASPQRLAPPCPYFGRCGGCAYQHIEYSHQLTIKTRQVRDALRRIGKFSDPSIQPIVASPNQYEYRNRITVHAQGGVLGFYRRDSNNIIDIERCPISRPEVNRALTELRAKQPREGHYTLRAESTPRIFTQTNDELANLLRDLIDQWIPPGQEMLIDAYCGAGFFAKALRSKFNRVLGIDWDRFAIDAAISTATENENYIAGDVEAELANIARNHGLPTADPKKLTAGGRQSLTLIVDPPATGLTDSVRQTIVDLRPERFIYVSCNPATLARDLREFSEKFVIASIAPFDMFPHTAEIEVVTFMRPAP